MTEVTPVLARETGFSPRASSAPPNPQTRAQELRIFSTSAQPDHFERSALLLKRLTVMELGLAQ